VAEPVLRFEYPGADADDGRGDPGRKHFYLCQTERAVSEIQVLDKGVHNRLHFHPYEDGVWFVLGGTVTFHGEGPDGEGDRVLGELGPHQGLLIPAGTKYWFEATSEEPLEIMRVDYKVPTPHAPDGTPVDVQNSYGDARWTAYGQA
jgi:mannose-6-phosphate isomerase-like protein (cupin superfamily)